MRTLLLELWAGKTIAEACDVLQGERVSIREPADRQLQLGAVVHIDEWLRLHARPAAIGTPAGSAVAAARRRPQVV